MINILSCFKQNMLENEAKCNNARFGTQTLLLNMCFIAKVSFFNILKVTDSL